MRKRPRKVWMGALVLYTALVYVLLVAFASRFGLLPASVSEVVESAVPASGLVSALLPS